MSRDFTTTLLTFIMIAAAATAQFAGYMNLDNAWLMHVAKRVVDGEQLGRQVIESNPPLIVYMLEIPALMAKYLNLSVMNSFTIFMIGLMVLSLGLASRFVKDRNIFLCLVFALAFIPSWAFGEREHIFIILILPYFVSLWDEGKKPFWFILLSGVMAGFGFALKPFFLAIWATSVITKMVLDRRFWSFINWQNIFIGATIAAYVAYLVFIDKIYINEIMPLLVKYYGGYNSQASEVYKQSLQLTLLCQVAFWIVFIKDRKLLTRPMYFANFANLIASLMIIIQAKTWLNYFYPPNFFGFITNVLITAVLYDNLKPLWNKVAALISSFILMLFVIIAISTNMKVGLRINEDRTENIIDVFDKYADGKSVYMLTFDLGTIFPAVLYTNAQYHGRYGHLWSLPGMYNKANLSDEEIIYRPPGERLDDETKLIAQVMADMNNNPPAIVIVMDSKYYSRETGNYKFDFIKYFSQEPEFAEMWKNYRRIKRIGNDEIWQRRLDTD